MSITTARDELAEQRGELEELVYAAAKHDDDDWYRNAGTKVLEAGYRKPRTIGYIVVDNVTKALDWDGELHPTEEDAIESLTGPHQMWCKSIEEETEERTFWGTSYMICPVEAAK